ncbi:MAG: hypothetical protein J5661_07975 [Bacteroidaceae bacterium]|nr:hypothetical protein [Bacteroidaceae bacterium]
MATLLAIVGASSVGAQTKEAYAVVSGGESQTLTVCKGRKSFSGHIPIYGLYADTENTTGQVVYPAEMLAGMKGCTISQLTFYTRACYKESVGEEFMLDCLRFL